jgi:hypothetical protein
MSRLVPFYKRNDFSQFFYHISQKWFIEMTISRHSGHSNSIAPEENRRQTKVFFRPLDVPGLLKNWGSMA